MSIATAKLAQSVFKRKLIRLVTARNLSPTLAHIGSNLWRYSFGAALATAGMRTSTSASTMVRDLTYPPAAPSAGNIHYYVDESTGDVTVNVGQTTPLNQETQAFIFLRYLFFTECEPADFTQNPEDSLTAIRNWQARLLEAPVIRQTQRNIIEGISTFDDTGFSLINADSYFQDYLGPYDSFKNGECLIWEYIETIANIIRIYVGKVAAVRIAGQVANFTVRDALAALNQSATFGITDFSKPGPTGSTNFPDHAQRLKTLALSAVSYYKTRQFSANGITDGAFDVSEAMQSVGNTDYNGTFTTSSSRAWDLGYVFGSLKTQTFGAIQAFSTFLSAGASGRSLLAIRLASSTNLYVGQTVKWTEAGTPYYGVIVKLGTFTRLAVSYNVLLDVGTSSGATMSLTSVFTALKTVGVFLSTIATLESNLPLYQSRDYTITEVAYGDFTLIQITLANNFEAVYGGFGGLALNPNTNDIAWFAATDEDFSHGHVVQKFLESAGLTVNAASITAANLALTDTVSFNVPGFDEISLDTYASYLTKILRSTLAYLSVQTDNSVVYALFATPSSTDVRNDDNILFATLGIGVDYEDVVTDITFINRHLPSGASASVFPRETRLAAAALHNLSATTEFEHVLALNVSGEIGRQDAIANILSSRRVTYDYATRTMDIDAFIGDDVSIQTDQILGGSGSLSAKITSIERGEENALISAIDLVGLT